MHSRILCDSFDCKLKKTRNSQSLESRNQNPTYGNYVYYIFGVAFYHIQNQGSILNLKLLAMANHLMVVIKLTAKLVYTCTRHYLGSSVLKLEQ